MLSVIPSLLLFKTAANSVFGAKGAPILVFTGGEPRGGIESKIRFSGS